MWTQSTDLRKLQVSLEHPLDHPQINYWGDTPQNTLCNYVPCVAGKGIKDLFISFRECQFLVCLFLLLLFCAASGFPTPLSQAVFQARACTKPMSVRSAGICSFPTHEICMALAPPDAACVFRAVKAKSKYSL